MLSSAAASEMLGQVIGGLHASGEPGLRWHKLQFPFDDGGRGAQLLTTLEAYLRAGCCAQSAARALGTHRKHRAKPIAARSGAVGNGAF
jgi:hypothetical protein